MVEPPDLGQLTLGRSAVYRITIGGHLDDSWFDQHVCASVYSAVLHDAREVTVVTAVFRDQAELFGVLNSLYGLGFPLLFVEFLVLTPE